MDSSNTIYVYDDFSQNEAVLMGRLFIDIIKGKEIYSFEYEEEWLNNTSVSFCLDPDIMLSPLYDVNPVPYGDELSLNVSDNDNRISFSLAKEVSEYFCISKDEAQNNIKFRK